MPKTRTVPVATFSTARQPHPPVLAIPPLALALALALLPITVEWAIAQPLRGPSPEELAALFEQIQGDGKDAPQACGFGYIGCGHQLTSALAADDCTTESGYKVDFWQFIPNLGYGTFAVASSPDFPPALYLFNPADVIVASGYSGGPVASYLYSPIRSFGVHTVAISTPTPERTGAYKLINACSRPSCRSDADTLCLAGGRYTLEVEWENQYSGARGRGIALPQTTRAGYFAFDNPANVELMVKVLDFGDVDKVFFGQLTDLHYTLTITDNVTSASEIYRNTPGNCGGIDQDAFDYQLAGATAKLRPRLNRRINRNLFPQDGTCVPGPNRLCLLANRFAVEMDWRNQYDGSSGIGGAHTYTDLTGQFYLPDPSNIELLVKILDFGDRILVLYGALSDLEYTLHVTDTLTGDRQHYANPAGNYCGGIDNDAF